MMTGGGGVDGRDEVKKKQNRTIEWNKILIFLSLWEWGDERD